MWIGFYVRNGAEWVSLLCGVVVPVTSSTSVALLGIEWVTQRHSFKRRFTCSPILCTIVSFVELLGIVTPLHACLYQKANSQSDTSLGFTEHRTMITITCVTLKYFPSQISNPPLVHQLDALERLTMQSPSQT